MTAWSNYSFAIGLALGLAVGFLMAFFAWLEIRDSRRRFLDLLTRCDRY